MPFCVLSFCINHKRAVMKINKNNRKKCALAIQSDAHMAQDDGKPLSSYSRDIECDNGRGGTHFASSDKNYNLAKMTSNVLFLVFRCLFEFGVAASAVALLCCYLAVLFLALMAMGSEQKVLEMRPRFPMVCMYVLKTANIDSVSTLRASLSTIFPFLRVIQLLDFPFLPNFICSLVMFSVCIDSICVFVRVGGN